MDLKFAIIEIFSKEKSDWIVITNDNDTATDLTFATVIILINVKNKLMLSVY